MATVSAPPHLRTFRWLTPVVAVAACAAGILGAERTLAWLYPGLPWESPETGDHGMMFYRFDPYLGLFHEPGFTGTVDGVTYTHNAKGLRDREVPYDKPSGRQRILMVGDSLTWGYGVGDGETFSDVLERSLPGTEVINLSVAGYGNGQELLLLRHEGLRYEPDQVVLVFCVANDVEDNYLADAVEAYPANVFHLREGRLAIAPFRVGPLTRMAIALRERSYVVNFLGKRVLGAATRQPGLRRVTAIERANLARLAAVGFDESSWAGLRYLRMDDPPGEEHYRARGGLLAPTPLNHYKVELTKQIVLEMAREVRGRGADFAVVLSPFKAELDPAGPYHENPLRRELARFLAAEGIATVDLLSRFESEGLDPDGLFLDGMHFSARGHEEVARLLREALL